jgi:hypothetical protein
MVLCGYTETIKHANRKKWAVYLTELVREKGHLRPIPSCLWSQWKCLREIREDSSLIYLDILLIYGRHCLQPPPVLNWFRAPKVGCYLRPILNLSPRGKLRPQGRSCPLGVKLSPEGEIICSSLHSSTETVKSDHPWGWTKGWTFPLGNKFHP